MNPNPYPQGRWTQVVASAANARKCARNRLMPESVASLVEAPLRELFWGIPESRLVEEATRRLQVALDAAVSAPASLSEMMMAEERPELAVA